MKVYEVTIDGITYEVAVEEIFRSGIRHRGSRETGTAPSSHFHEATAEVSQKPLDSTSKAETANPTTAKAPDTAIPAPIQGSIYKILVKEGQHLKAGDTILILEAMKLENEIVAPRDGVVGRVYAKEGDTVDAGDPLIDFSPEA